MHLNPTRWGDGEATGKEARHVVSIVSGIVALGNINSDNYFYYNNATEARLVANRLLAAADEVERLEKEKEKEK